MTSDHIDSARPKRNPITLKIRFDIFKRDAFTCQYCGATPPNSVLELDHINPVCLGGNDESVNLITSCFDCNRGKGGRPLTDIPPPYSTRTEKIEEANRQAGAYRAAIALAVHIDDEFALSVHEIIFACIYFQRPKSMDAELRSIKGFMQRLDNQEIVNAATLAAARKAKRADRFKYFCGICWKKIRGEYQ